MDYPLWLANSDISGALVIALVSIFHVFISHFAVGMGLFLVLAEKKALKEQNEELKIFVKKTSALVLLISAVLGALTGVGIWFTIALVSPAGTSALIHNFVWGWAAEWVFFVLEIVTILVYYYTWNKVSDKYHVLLGWLYFVGAYMSLVIIVGIITFQLTPGKWIETHSFWDGFLNPTYIPSIVGRTGIALLLAGIYAMITLSLMKNSEVKKNASRFSGYFVLAGIILTFVGMTWWVFAIPADIREQFLGGNMTLTNFFKYSGYITAIMGFLTLLFMFVLPRYINIAITLIILILGQISFGYYEFTRERARKPFVIRDYMYSNGILVSEVEKLNEEGILSKAKWANIENEKDVMKIGRAVFVAECKICHSLNGFNALRPKIEGLEAEDIDAMLMDLDSNPLMPPFVGTDAEREALAKYLAKIAQ
ncbi:cytochrome C [Deferribacter autotrophicus]|uniref:Cytochrome C n=1 Tax=Deferribacter autotrophicus TaxID=500465 RepID=A0A5A8F7D6_9BACT|nr:cytochrome ubiquinol oxidase subunit I [Deferribacter autotrophicus]KAA0259299.1 cytochrome C [Deferribacter autotrophicus]